MFTRDAFIISFTSTTAVTSWHFVLTSLTLARMTGQKKANPISMMTQNGHTTAKEPREFFLANSFQVHTQWLGEARQTFFFNEIKYIYVFVYAYLGVYICMCVHTSVWFSKTHLANQSWLSSVLISLQSLTWDVWLCMCAASVAAKRNWLTPIPPCAKAWTQLSTLFLPLTDFSRGGISSGLPRNPVR